MNNRLDCTLIIPSHNRHEYLERIFEYYKGVNFDVVCCDSSEKKYDKKIPENIKYLHLPSLNFKQKMFKTISEANTEYIVCCADDDFILKEAIPYGVEFLEQNNDYNSFVGQYAGFLKEFNNNFYLMYSQSSNYQPADTCENIDSFMRNYHMILWGLYRKQDLLIAYEIIEKAEFSNDNFIELIIGITLSSRGKIKINDNRWGIREIDNKTEHWGSRHKSLCIEDEIIIKKDIKAIKEAITGKLEEKYFDIGLNAYMDFCNKAVSRNNEKSKYFKSKIISYVKSIIPVKVKSFLNQYRNNSLCSDDLKEIKKVLNN